MALAIYNNIRLQQKPKLDRWMSHSETPQQFLDCYEVIHMSQKDESNR